MQFHIAAVLCLSKIRFIDVSVKGFHHKLVFQFLIGFPGGKIKQVLPFRGTVIGLVQVSVAVTNVYGCISFKFYSPLAGLKSGNRGTPGYGT
jgi:hypothetical protein